MIQKQQYKLCYLNCCTLPALLYDHQDIPGNTSFSELFTIIYYFFNEWTSTTDKQDDGRDITAVEA